MKKIDLLINEYGESHQNKINKLIHWLCVPAIFFSIVVLVWSIPLGPLNNLKISGFQYINWSTLIMLVVLIYYINLSPILTIGMILFSSACLFLTNYLENLINDGLIKLPLWSIGLIIFIIAWIIQFVGHEIEGKKPSFLKDIQFLLIGPAWLMHFIYKKLNIKY
jgi:Predicted membrane protein